ncbi:efflux RND transporter periplasmic adaptor subunit [Calothrix sp. UHCC 0171]|uniref:efflux RND transporter periplasmic adaptor subunit n=1 Tax=Calothrix sp. UHCC 0171 TaxID=3110245 RepID=UPI002B20EA2F|nr:efflux RND transporter periplasmic adaptor subunit [Calothrix sp. UHCC 0171]MEA5571226.1 efflux RND transporter periplasmic adaptor subunit [Calothrix sp. UHCC 0171]
MATYIDIPVISKKIKPPSRWILGLIAASVFIGGAIATQTLTNKGMRQEDIAQQTVPVAAQNVTLRITASGKVSPIQSVNISPKNSGIVSQLYVEQGDKVEKGQIIARMNSDDIQARVQQARANLAQAQAQLNQARAGNRPQEIAQTRSRLAQTEAQLAAARAGNRPQEIAQAQAQVDAAAAKANYTSEQVKRYRYLVEQGAERKQLLDQALSEDNAAKASLRETQKRLSLQQSGSRAEDIAQRQAAVAEARASLQLMESGSRPEEIAQRQAAVAAAQAQLQAELVTLEDSIIRAPFSGIITQKYANVGAFVTPTTSASASASATSSSLVALVQGLEVLASVPEADIGRIKTGQEVEIVSDAYPEQVFKGQVRLVAPEAVKEEGVTLFQVRVKIVTGEDKLRSGLNVDLTFLGDDVPNALLVPTVAIVTEKGNTGVLVPNAQNQPQFRSITIGSQIKDQTQIVEGLKQGDRIFLNPPPEYQKQKAQEKKDK